MTYAIFSEQGYIDEMCTFLGLEQLAGFIDKQPGLPDLKLFMEQGYSTEPEKCIAEIDFIMDKASGEVQHTLQHLLDSLKKISEVVIISQ